MGRGGGLVGGLLGLGMLLLGSWGLAIDCMLWVWWWCCWGTYSASWMETGLRSVIGPVGHWISLEDACFCVEGP
jgi:hypothetical protein